MGLPLIGVLDALNIERASVAYGERRARNTGVEHGGLLTTVPIGGLVRLLGRASIEPAPAAPAGWIDALDAAPETTDVAPGPPRCGEIGYRRRPP